MSYAWKHGHEIKPRWRVTWWGVGMQACFLCCWPQSWRVFYLCLINILANGRRPPGRRRHICEVCSYRPLATCGKLRVARAPGMSGMFSPPLRVSDPAMHHGTCATHVPWCIPGSLTVGFLWSRWRGKRSRHSRRIHRRQIYVYGKRRIG